MAFIKIADVKPEMVSVSIKLPKALVEELERYQRFTRRGTRSEAVADILQTVFDNDNDFIASKVGKKKQPVPMSGPGPEAVAS